ncbi:MAG: SMI1/KNR4 family protein [Salinivirgaceae bacterium]|nr:SMI1/KNR4 family protein [Salinivirgaceae bacterium]
MDWMQLFDEASPAPGADDDEIEKFVSSIQLPLTESEADEISQNLKNPFPPTHPLHASYKPFDPKKWMMPDKPLPADYVSLLRWSNGGWCRSGEREFGFFPTSDAKCGVRAMLLAYHLPEYMPLALPFAFNGGGVFYLFDMREESIAGEYPVVCSHAGNIGWGHGEYNIVAESFSAVCRGKTNVDHLL